MLNENPDGRVIVIMFLVFFCKGTLFRPFDGKHRVYMKFLQTLVSGIGAQKRIAREVCFTLFEQMEVVPSSDTESSRDYLVSVVDDQLRFERVTLLFA